MNAVDGLDHDFARIGLAVLRGAGLRAGPGDRQNYRLGPCRNLATRPLGKLATQRAVPLYPPLHSGPRPFVQLILSAHRGTSIRRSGLGPDPKMVGASCQQHRDLAAVAGADGELSGHRSLVRALRRRRPPAWKRCA